MSKAEFMDIARDTFIISTTTPLSVFLNDMLQSEQVQDHPQVRQMYESLAQLASQGATERDLQAGLDVRLMRIVNLRFTGRDELEAFVDHGRILKRRLSTAGAYDYRSTRYLTFARRFLSIGDSNRVALEFSMHIEAREPAPSPREIARLASLAKISIHEFGGITAEARATIDQFVRDYLAQ